MNLPLTTAVLATIVLLAGPVRAAETPELPQPTSEHKWLQSLAGEWQTEATMYAEGEEPVTTTGTETIRTVGGFWIVCEHQGEFMDQPFTGIMTLGYDTEKQQTVGTWVDSITGQLWTYQGTLDEAAGTVTLHTEGCCPLTPGVTLRIKEVLEVKGPEQKVFTSYVEQEDGTWLKGMQIVAKRKK